MAMTLLPRRRVDVPTIWGVFGRVACLIGFLLLPNLPGIAAVEIGAEPTVAAPRTCSLANIGSLLAPYDGEVVLAQVDETPELLFRSRVRTVGSLYHRSVAGFTRAYEAWRSAPGTSEPTVLRATNATLVLA